MSLAQETALVPPVIRRDSTEICGLVQVCYVNYTGKSLYVHGLDFGFTQNDLPHERVNLK